MATELLIEPSAGHAPFPYQRAIEPGVFEGFDAIDYRRFWSRQYDEGVTTGDAWKVHETTAGPSLQIEVDGNVASAFVEGDSVADQGLYYVAPHGSLITLDVDAPDATNPRVDRVVLQVRDNEHDGSGEQDARVVVIAGTPTAGATLENEAGIASLPDTALLLSHVLVGAGATTISNAEIRDMRTYGMRDARLGDLSFSAATTPDAGWVPCDGRALNRKQHARLFAKIGTTYGAGDGSTTFNAPDFDGRSPVGSDPSGKRGVVRAAGEGGGEVNHTLSEAELPAHDHPFGTVVTGGVTGAGTFYEQIATNDTSKKHMYWDIGTQTSNISGTQNAGSGSSHNNMHPFAVCSVFVFTGSAVG